MRLENFAKAYCRRLDLSKAYRRQLVSATSAMSRLLERPADVRDLNVKNINALTGQTDGVKGPLSKTTRTNRRRMMLTLASAAAREKRIKRIDPFFIDRIRVDKKLPVGYSFDQAQAIVKSLQNPKGLSFKKWLNETFSNDVRRGDWWLGYLLACWDVGHPKDLRLTFRSEVDMNGRFFRIRQKTNRFGKIIKGELSPAAMQMVFKIHKQTKDRYLFPQWCRCESWKCGSEEYKIIAMESGVGGYLGYFRSGSGTQVENENPGRGHEFLANSRRIFEQNYQVMQHLRNQETLRPKPLLESA